MSPCIRKPRKGCCIRPTAVQLVLLALSTAVIWDEKQRTHKALEEKAFQERLASQNAMKAMEQRQRAVWNFNREHAVMRRVLLELQDRKWSQFPEINKLRQAVAEDVLGFLKERLLQEGSIDPDIQRMACLRERRHIG